MIGKSLCRGLHSAVTVMRTVAAPVEKSFGKVNGVADLTMCLPGGKAVKVKMYGWNAHMMPCESIKVR